MVTFDRVCEAHPAAIAGALREHVVAHHDGELAEPLATRTRRRP